MLYAPCKGGSWPARKLLPMRRACSWVRAVTVGGSGPVRYILDSCGGGREQGEREVRQRESGEGEMGRVEHLGLPVVEGHESVAHDGRPRGGRRDGGRQLSAHIGGGV